MTVDGSSVSGNLIPIPTDKDNCEVYVTMGA